MELNLDSKVIAKRITIGGKSYDVLPITVKGQLEIVKAVKGIDPKSLEYSEMMISFMSKTGVPEEVLYQMSTEQFQAFTEFVTGSSEKK